MTWQMLNLTAPKRDGIPALRYHRSSLKSTGMHAATNIGVYIGSV